MPVRRRLANVAAGAVLGGAVYLLLIDTTSLPELYVGAAVALLAGLGFEAAREQGAAEAAFSPRVLARAWRVLARIPLDIARVSLAALAQLVAPRAARGDLRAFHFRHGGESAHEVGRRALAEALGSLPPNTIVIGVDPDRDLILGHQLKVNGGADAVDVLGLR